MPINRWLLHPWALRWVWLCLCVPAVYLFFSAWTQRLGANPAEALIRSTGDWTLRGLCLTLSITPLRTHTGWSGLARWRRVLGLGTFGYAFMHFCAYAWLDMGLDAEEIAIDIGKRPFIWVGFAALVLLATLAATSFPVTIKALGAKRWQMLHRSVYAIAALAVLHFFWMRAAKHNLVEVAVYAAALGFLLLWRVRRWMIKSASNTY